MKHILLITMLTIKILFTITSLFLKKNCFVKTLFTIPSVKKTFSFDQKKIHFIKQKLLKLRTFHFN